MVEEQEEEEEEKGGRCRAEGRPLPRSRRDSTWGETERERERGFLSMDGATVREGDIFLWTTGRLTRGQETVTRWWEEPWRSNG